jgi:uncharacterized protein DUF87
MSNVVDMVAERDAKKIRLGSNAGGVAAMLDLEQLMGGGIVVQATRGAGKSYLVRRIAEQANGRLHQVIIDPDGEYLSLADCYEYVVVSSAEALRIGGAALAIDLRTRRYDAVIDLSDAESEARTVFIADLCIGLVETPRALWHPLLLIIDEVQKILPKGDDGDVDKETRQRAIKKFADLMGRGRKRGLSTIVATNRISETATPAISKATSCLIGRTVFDRDIERAAFALGRSKGKTAGLRRLANGEFIGGGPAFGPATVRFTVAPVTSRHGGTAPALDRPPQVTADEARVGIAELLAQSEPAAAAEDPAPSTRAQEAREPDRRVSLSNADLDAIRAGFADNKSVREISLERNRSYDSICKAARRLGLDFASRVAWTDAEIEIVRAGGAAKRSARRIASDLVAAGYTRSISAVQNRLNLLGLSKHKDETVWTAPEKQIVRAGYAAKRSRDEIVADLAAAGHTRTRSSIGWIAGELGLNQAPAVWSDADIARLRELAARRPRMKLCDVAEALNRPYGGVAAKMNQLNIRLTDGWTPEERQKLIDAPGQGKSLLEIATELGRPYANVAKLSEYMGISFKRGPKAKPRIRNEWTSPEAVGAIAVDEARQNQSRTAIMASPERICIYLRSIGKKVTEVRPGAWTVDAATVYDLPKLLERTNKFRSFRREPPFVLAAPWAAENSGGGASACKA